MKKKPVRDILFSQENFVKNLFTLFLLAFGINLLANQIPTFFKIDPLISIITGIVLIFLSLIYLLRQITDKRKRYEKFKAFFIYNQKENKLEEIPNYEFSSDQNNFMKAAFVEDSNLKIFWEKSPISQYFQENDEASKYYRSYVKIFNELTEFLVLRQLSFTLDSYFNESNCKETKKYGRNDVQEILLKNRFLEKISHPMSERASFNFEDTSDDAEGKVVYATGPNDETFEDFELSLPKNCILRKPKDNVIIIDTDKMSISITTNFQGNTIRPDEFVKCYLKIDDSEIISAL
jgi:hypothetical protein